ncbi:MAG: hypothetical protein Q9M35_09285 [Rhodothermus sp.]|nr:hypothetical protein [Rhodothermus sp.]
MEFPALLEISFPLDFPERFLKKIREQRRRGLASLELLGRQIKRSLASHLRTLPGCGLHLYVLRSFNLKESVWTSRQQIETLTADKLTPLIFLRSMHFDGQKLIPGNRLRENLYSGSNKVIEIQLNLQEDHRPSLPDHRVVRETLSCARQVAICLRYWWEVDRSIQQMAWGSHRELSESVRGRPPLTTEELRQTIELVIEELQHAPSLTNQELYRLVAEHLQAEGLAIDTRGVWYRIETALQQARVSRFKGRYRIEDLQAALKNLS